jgi:hypothetical protein
MNTVLHPHIRCIKNPSLFRERTHQFDASKTRRLSEKSTGVSLHQKPVAFPRIRHCIIKSLHQNRVAFPRPHQQNQRLTNCVRGQKSCVAFSASHKGGEDKRDDDTSPRGEDKRDDDIASPSEEAGRCCRAGSLPGCRASFWFRAPPSVIIGVETANPRSKPHRPDAGVVNGGSAHAPYFETQPRDRLDHQRKIDPGNDPFERRLRSKEAQGRTCQSLCHRARRHRKLNPA